MVIEWDFMGYTNITKRKPIGRWDNHTKTMGKPWENGGCSWDFMGFTPPGKCLQKSKENVY